MKANYSWLFFRVMMGVCPLVITAAASADMTYNVTGTVNEVTNIGVVTPPIGIGSTLTGQFTFEVLTPPGYTAANYSDFPGAVTSVSLAFSGLSPITITGTGRASTTNHVGSPSFDELEIDLYPGDGAIAPSIEGLLYIGSGLFFYDVTDTLFSANPPSLVNPDHPLLSTRSFYFGWIIEPEKEFNVGGTFNITQIPPNEVVPAPGAILLGSIGISFAASLLRRCRAL